MPPKTCAKAPAAKKTPTSPPATSKRCKRGPLNVDETGSKPKAKKAKKGMVDNEQDDEKDGERKKEKGGKGKGNRQGKKTKYVSPEFCGSPI